MHLYELQAVIIATGQLHTTVIDHVNINETSQLMLCLMGLPASAPIPLDTVHAGIKAGGQNIASASGSMTIGNITFSEGCSGTMSSLEAAATHAAILVEDLEHWHISFPRFGVAQLVWLTVPIDA
jgi:hypothetical protein